MSIKCKICRRSGAKLFLKGERCLSPKCAMVKKPYPPGIKKKKRGSSLSEYGKELKEKQKLKNWYNISEKQFRIYVKKVLEKKGMKEDTAASLIKNLEIRFDNVIFRLGWASSRVQARQMVSHKHFLINGKTVNVPSYQLKKGDEITIRSSSKKLSNFKNLPMILKKYEVPSWLKLDLKEIKGNIKSDPSIEEAGLPVEISAVFEFYSK